MSQIMNNLEREKNPVNHLMVFLNKKKQDCLFVGKIQALQSMLIFH